MRREGTASRRVVEAWGSLLAEAGAACRQERVRWRLLVLSLGLVAALGRRTLSQIIVTIGWGDAEWSAWYRLLNRGRVRWEVLQRQVVKAVVAELSPKAPFAAVVDATHLPRTSERMPGVGWARQPRTPAWRRGIHRAQRWVGLNALLPRSANGDSRALPVRWIPAVAPKAVPITGYPAMTEWQAGVASIHWLRSELDAVGAQARSLLVVGDGAYSGSEVWRTLPPRTTLIARRAKNRALFALPPALKGPGRPRKYGAQLPSPSAQLAMKGFTTVPTMVRGRDLSLQARVVGPLLVKPAADQPLFLVVVKGVDRGQGKRRRHRDPCYLLVNARGITRTKRATTPEREPETVTTWRLPLPLTEILTWTWQRWEVEVMHKELKSGFGLGQQQAWSATGTVTSVQWVTWLYATLILAGYRAWGYRPPGSATLGAWWRPRRWSLATLWQAIRQEVWHLEEFQPVWGPSPDKWHEMTTWITAASNPLTGYRRI